MFMYTVSPIYRLTEHLHGAFLGDNPALTEEERCYSGVGLATGDPNTTQKLLVHGLIKDRLAYQTLARDTRGNFHLSTVFPEYGGAHLQTDIRPDATEETAGAIRESLFMQALMDAALRQNQV
ncbi:hypothetical protein IPL68_06225 [Candidatus Saccharibacteria bacterium]|nr:MAG: hypothetical protein IPL68_06225 [Candidatus Saccharibacteria bacterium]